MTDRPKFKYRVLRGNHADGKYPEGHPFAGRSLVYEIGEILETTSRLEKFNANGPLGPKFQRIYDPNIRVTDKLKQGLDEARRREQAELADDGNGPFGAGPLPPPSDGLDDMSITELRKLAKEEGLQVQQNATQADLIEAIRKSAVAA